LGANDRKFDYDGNFDVDGTPRTVLAVDRVEGHEQKSGELRFSSSLNGRLNFTAGALFLEHHYELDYDARSATQVQGLAPEGPGVAVLVIDNDQTSKYGSLYAQGNLRFNEQWSLDVGATTVTKKNV
jgi:outer membrane receptor protein involved in Fe transport